MDVIPKLEVAFGQDQFDLHIGHIMALVLGDVQLTHFVCLCLETYFQYRWPVEPPKRLPRSPPRASHP
eukprot:2185710-Amphidinium_carterae.1